MSLIFAAIYRQGNILVEYTDCKGNFEQMGLTVSKKCTQGRTSFQEGQYYFHTLCDQGFVYICMTEVNYMRADAYSFLDQIKNLLYTKCPDEISKSSVAFGLQKKLRNDIKVKYDLYNSPDASKLRRAQTNLEDTKDVVIKNLEKVLERSEKLELLVEKSNTMVVSSSRMKDQATAIRRQQQWKRIRLYILIGVGSLLAIYIIIGISCGFDFGCFKSSKKDDEKKRRCLIQDASQNYKKNSKFLEPKLPQESQSSSSNLNELENLQTDAQEYINDFFSKENNTQKYEQIVEQFDAISQEQIDLSKQKLSDYIGESIDHWFD